MRRKPTANNRVQATGTRRFKARLSGDLVLKNRLNRASQKFTPGLIFLQPKVLPCRQVARSKVTFAGDLKGYGQAVIVDHGLGATSLYGQLGEISVHAGEQIKAGAEIARVGPGQDGRPPHVHFEVRHGGSVGRSSQMIERSERFPIKPKSSRRIRKVR